ncbi:MAG: hypothetical protein IGNPGNKH_00525 [Sodalis sp. Ffu]|nr:MAG: hypothetical protein IGNPGNKH_00525 [Sodalis sp. Ffu]
MLGLGAIRLHLRFLNDALFRPNIESSWPQINHGELLVDSS